MTVVVPGFPALRFLLELPEESCGPLVSQKASANPQLPNTYAMGYSTRSQKAGGYSHRCRGALEDKWHETVRGKPHTHMGYSPSLTRNQLTAPRQAL